MRAPKALKAVYRPDLITALAVYLSTIDNQFDMDGWIENESGGWSISFDNQKKLRGNPKWKTHKACGTVACAMGHAPSVPVLAKAGLKINYDLLPEYKGKTGFGAAMELFGISKALAAHFFDPVHYKGKDTKDPKIVAERLFAFVADPFGYMARNELMWVS